MTGDKQQITAEDLYKIVYSEDPRISPNGKWIAFVQILPDKFDNGYKRNIWLLSIETGDLHQLTRSGKDSQPRWSPDSKWLAFTSARGDKPQIFLLPVSSPSGESRQLTNMQNGANSPAWSPDCTQIAFLAGMTLEDRAQEDQTDPDLLPKDKLESKHFKERKEAQDTKRWDPRIVERIPYRTGTSYLTDQYNQIYIIQTQEGLSKEQTKARRVTDINADHNAPQWTPDGKYLITARMDDPKRDEPWRWSSIFRIRIEDLKTEQLTDASYSSFGPISSPDGQWIAFGRYPRERLSERITRLAVMPSIGGTITDLNLVHNRNMIEFKWKADGKGLLYTATDRGVIGLYQVDIETKQSSLVIAGNLHIESFDCHPEGDIAFSASSPTNPSELFWKPSSESTPVQKTFTNEKFLETRHIQDTHELSWETKGGVQVQGWYILPVGYEREKQYPLALNIHGGPHIMWGPATKSMWHEWQFQAAQGYVVFFCNPQGADGYGEDFQMALHANWGNLAMDDIMAGVERLIEKGFVDTNRLAVTGGSYGGYMTAWIASHSDRFAAAVAQRGVYNLLGFIGNTDITSFIPTEFGVEPWDDPMMLWNNSPLSHAHKIKTPILLIHSENDFRVPISEAEQMFTYIRRSGGTVKLIRFPREGHELTRTGEPEHRVSNLLHVIDWFNQFCQPRSQNSKGHPVP